MATRKTREELDAEMAQMPDARESTAEPETAEKLVSEAPSPDEEEPSGAQTGEEEPVPQAGALGEEEEPPAEPETDEKLVSEAPSPDEEEPSDALAGEEEPIPQTGDWSDGEAPPAEAELADAASEKVELEPARAARLRSLIESLLFAAAAPIGLKDLLDVIQELHPELSSKALRGLIDALQEDLREHGRGVRVAEVAGGFQLRTPSEAAPFVRKLVARRPPRLTRATLETLAIVAYRQPITRPEVEDIRGVDCGAVLRHLLDKKLVRILGRKDEVGRPLLYATTAEFLEFFGLKDLKSLPELKDFVELTDEHRAQLGLDPKAAEVSERQQAEAEMADLVIEDSAAYDPVGEDEVIAELAEALDDLRKRDRDLKQAGILPGSGAPKGGGPPTDGAAELSAAEGDGEGGADDDEMIEAADDEMIEAAEDGETDQPPETSEGESSEPEPGSDHG